MEPAESEHLDGLLHVDSHEDIPYRARSGPREFLSLGHLGRVAGLSCSSWLLGSEERTIGQGYMRF